MKTLIAISIGALGFSSARAAPGWETDFAAARKQAQEQKKDLLIDFTGSDWCGWCKRLKEEVFDHQEFREGVQDRYVLVEVDFPRDKTGMSEALLKQNEELKKAFGIRGYPTIMLADARGRPYAQTGYQRGGAGAYLKHLEEKQNNRALRDEALGEAGKVSGENRAKHLEAALAIVPRATLGTLYRKEFDELASLHAESELIESTRAEEAGRAQREAFRKFFTGKDYTGALAYAEEILAQGELVGESRQQVLHYKLNACLAQRSFDEALAVAEEIRKVDPGNRFGQGAERVRTYIEKLKEQDRQRQRLDGIPKVDEEQGKGREKKRDRKGSALAEVEMLLVTVEGEPQLTEGSTAGEENKKKGTDVIPLRKSLAGTRRELAAVKSKIEADHELWTRVEREIAMSRKRMAELETALAGERANLTKLRESRARIEREHNGDHDREKELAARLTSDEKALVDFESKQDKISGIEKKAAELRLQAEELRKRAEELREE